MLFTVSRVSHQNYNITGKPPVGGAVKKHGFWVIVINSLQDLMGLQFEVGCEISLCEDHLTILDDYQ